MRHLRSILYAIVLAPAVWILCGVGFTSDLVGRARESDSIGSLTGLLLLLLAGAGYAILVFAPVSPAGPSLAGLAFLGIALWALAAPASYAGVWAPGIAKPGFDLSRPGYGLAALLAVPLLCTALSARRWEQYVPPHLPLIGTLGRPSGAAPVAGTPVSAVETAVLPVPAAEGDTTQVMISAPAASAPAIPAPVISAPRVALASTSDTRGATAPADESTVIVVSDSDERPTEAMERSDEEPTEAVTKAEDGPDSELPTDAIAGSDEPTEAVLDSEPDESTEPVVTTTDEETAEAVRAPVLTGGVGADGEEQTQIIRLPAADPASDKPTRDPSGNTGVDSPGELTQVISTSARTSATGSSDHGERTQVISVPPRRTAPIDGDRTQVIGFRTGTVEPPGDRTQVLTFPTQGAPGRKPPGEQTIADQEAPTRPNSIIGEERPNPGEDPTTRIVPPPRPDKEQAQQSGDETTVDVGGGKGAMTVMNLERPADEAADDTRQLVAPPIPAQRRPTGEDA